MRRVLLAAALVITGSCGGSPTAPALNTDVPSPRPVVLPAGAYTLAIRLSTTGLPVCQNGFCTSNSLCFAKPASMTASFSVDLERNGDRATVRVPGTASALVLDLQLAPTSVTGTIAGAAPDANGVPIEVSGTVTGARPLDTATAVAGNIDGQMSVPDGGCSNNGHAWSLTPR
jgi:hypothetical protein